MVATNTEYLKSPRYLKNHGRIIGVGFDSFSMSSGHALLVSSRLPCLPCPHHMSSRPASSSTFQRDNLPYPFNRSIWAVSPMVSQSPSFCLTSRSGSRYPEKKSLNLMDEE